MTTIIKHTAVTLALVLVFASASFAQQPTPSASPNQPDIITEKNFRNKVFEVKHRDPSSLASALYGLGSGFKGSMISHNTEFRTISVRDFPENLAIMEEAIKRLDVPATPRPNIELHMHVLIASNAGGATTEVPAEIRDVLTQLRATLNYRNYELATSVIQRLADAMPSSRGKGTAEMSGPQATAPNTALPYEYVISSVSLAQNPSGGTTIQISKFGFYAVKLTDGTVQAQIETALNLREGEKVVVGTATLKDRALIIVLTAKLIR